MELSKMFPKRAKFKIAALKKEFELRELTVLDEIWMHNNIDEKFLTNLNELDLLTGTRLAFQLMMDEDKAKYFKKVERTFITEDGEEETKTLGGVVLFQSILSGQKEQIEMFNAVFQTIINSRPAIEKKKKKMEKKKIVMKPKR